MKILFTLLFTLALPALPNAQNGLPPPFPRTNATKLLETDRIVIWNIVWPKGQPTALHRHVYDQVGTYYMSGGRVITNIDGSKREAVTAVGTLSTTRKGTTHIEEGNTDPPLRAVFIELKQDAPSGLASPAADAAAFSRPGGKQTFDDERVHVTDYTAVSGSESSARALNETVIVYLGDGRLRVTGEDGTSQELRVQAGTMRHVARGTRLREAALDGTPRALAFEIK